MIDARNKIWMEGGGKRLELHLKEKRLDLLATRKSVN
jgi:hypothetical protein